MKLLRVPSAIIAGLAAAVALGGCSGYGHGQSGPSAGSTSDAVPGPATQPAMVPCNAQPAQFAVGQSSTAAVVESARARSGAQMARIVRPGQILTKEFDAQRLNLEVDGNGKVLAVRCG